MVALAVAVVFFLFRSPQSPQVSQPAAPDERERPSSQPEEESLASQSPPPTPQPSQRRPRPAATRRQPASPSPAAPAAKKTRPQKSATIAATTQGRPIRPRRRVEDGRFADDALWRELSKAALRTPPDAEFIMVDMIDIGLENPSELWKFRSHRVFLPPGKHEVRFRKYETDKPVTITGDVFARYEAVWAHFSAGGKLRRDELTWSLLETLDCPKAPYLPHLLGNVYSIDHAWEAAARNYERVVRDEPAFAPAHLNLAYVYHQLGKPDAARRELALAHIFNFGNVFGIAAGIGETARVLRFKRVPTCAKLSLSDYTGREKLDATDERVIRIVQTYARFIRSPEDRAKAMCNIAAYFNQRNKYTLALDRYRMALRMLGGLRPRSSSCMAQVLQAMAEACRQAGWDMQQQEYLRMSRQLGGL